MNIVFLISFLTGFIIWTLSFTKGKQPLRALFYLWIFSFLVGPRGIYPFGIRFFFAEGVTWMDFFMYLFRLGWFNFKIYPKYTFLIFLSFIVGIGTALYYGRDIKTVIYEFKVFLLIIPVFYITDLGINYLHIDFKKIIKILCIGSGILSLVGIIFYFFSFIINFLPQNLVGGESRLFVVEEEYIYLGEEKIYTRGGGGFWEFTHLATFLTIIFPLSYMNLFLGRKKNILKWFIFLLISMAIIINGKRSVWLGVLMGVVCFSFLHSRVGTFLLFLSLLIVIYFLPQEVIDRFFSIFEVSERSWTGRIARYSYSWNIISNHPFLGIGWAGAGWVHNFVLQIGANLGLPALFVFLIWLGRMYIKGFIFSRIKHNDIVFAFLIGAIMYLGPLLGETVITYPDLMIPFWYSLAILEYSNYIEEQKV